MKIAIVGCGISGANTLKSIMDHKNFSDALYIDIFEKRDQLAVGIAYEDDDLHKLLNTPLEHMNIGIDDKDDFKNWLYDNYGKLPTIESKIPRPIFGKYAKDKYQKYFDQQNVCVYKNQVDDLIKEADDFYIKSSDKSYGPYQAVFLSIGQSYYKDDYGLNSFKNYTSNPYPLKEKINSIDKDDKIGIIGTGPSSVDIYRYLRRYFKFKTPLYFFTHSSFFALPEIRVNPPSNICSIDKDWIKKHKNNKGFIKLSDFEKTFYDDFKKASVDFDKTYLYYKDNNPILSKEALKKKDRNLEFFQTYTLELWYVGTELYNSFYGIDRKKFRDDYMPKIVHLMTKTPASTMENILADIDKGKIKVVKDTEDINFIEDQFKVQTQDKQRFFVDKLYNAQGFEKDLFKAIENDILLKNLFDRRLIEPDYVSNINVSYPSYTPITSKYGPIENLYLNGMWTESVNISNNDLRSMLISSKEMADDFMNKLEK